MRQTLSHLVVLLVILVSTATAGPVLEEGFAVGGAKEIVVSGTVFDSASESPIAGAQVSVLSDTTTDRTTTGPDGSFSIVVASTENLGALSIEVSAYGYQSKYLETLLRDTFRNRVDVEVAATGVQVKSKKLSASLACGESAPVEARTGGTSPVGVVCRNGLSGVELTVRKNRIAITATPPYAIRVEGGSVGLRGLAGGRVEIRAAAAMLPR